MESYTNHWDSSDTPATVTKSKSKLGTPYTKITTLQPNRRDIENALKEYTVTVQRACNGGLGYYVNEYHLYDRSKALQLISDALDNVLTIAITISDKFGNRIRYLPEVAPQLRELVLNYLPSERPPSPPAFGARTPAVIDYSNAAVQYRKKRDAAIAELIAHGHPATITFKIGTDYYEVTSHQRPGIDRLGFTVTQNNTTIKEAR